MLKKITIKVEVFSPKSAGFILFGNIYYIKGNTIDETLKVQLT